MTSYSQYLFEFKDYIILLLGLLLSISWTYILYKLKPKIEVESVQLESNDNLRINVVNKGRFDAVNLKIEACVTYEPEYTYHLKIDREDFLILPSKKKGMKDPSRIFKINEISESAKQYFKYQQIINLLRQENNNYILRIRIHANHSYSGFGRAFESKFKFTKGEFVKFS